MSFGPKLLPALVALGLSGCAVMPPSGAKPPDTPATAARPPGPAGSAPAAPGTATPPTPPGQPQPFATVTKDAKQVASGLFPVWQKDEKFWLELKPTDFGKPFFLSPKIARGIGEAGFYGGSMASNWPWR